MMNSYIRVRLDDRLETLQGGLIMLALIIEQAYIELMFSQASITHLDMFLGLAGIRAGGVGTD
jgi:hypothetical protein